MPENIRKLNEGAVRFRAEREGYLLRRSRARVWKLEDRGEYMLCDMTLNVPVLGWHYDASLEEIIEYLQ